MNLNMEVADKRLYQIEGPCLWETAHNRGTEGRDRTGETE